MTTDKNDEILLRTLADETAAEKERAAAADALTGAGLRIVMDKDRTAVHVDSTLDMWEHPAPLTTWGRKHLPICDAREAVPVKEFELDPISLEELADGYNSSSGADWKPVKPEYRALVRWATQRGRLHVDPADLAAALARDELSERLKRCRTEATPEELAACAKQLKGKRRVTTHHAQQEAPLGMSGRTRSGARYSVTFAGSVGAIQVGDGNIANVGSGYATTLTGFLQSAFGASELRRFIAFHLPELDTEINWSGSLSSVVFETAGIIIRRGCFDARLGAALIEARPHRAEEIRLLLRSNPRM